MSDTWRRSCEEKKLLSESPNIVYLASLLSLTRFVGRNINFGKLIQWRTRRGNKIGKNAWNKFGIRTWETADAATSEAKFASIRAEHL